MSKKITKITIFLIILILVTSNLSCGEVNQLLNENKSLKVQVHEIYLLNLDESADIYTQIIYTNYNNESLPFIENFSFSFPIKNYSKDNISNITLFFLPDGPYFELAPYSTIKSSNQYTYSENITQVSEQIYSHYITVNVNLQETTMGSYSAIIENIRYRYTNSSVSIGQEKMIFIPINKFDFSKKTVTPISNVSYDLRVDIPNSPYITTKFISSNVNPSKITSKGNGQSIYWDSKPNDDIVFIYTIKENSVSKKLDILIYETNSFVKKSTKFNDIATVFTVICILIAIAIRIVPRPKENNPNDSMKKRRI